MKNLVKGEPFCVVGDFNCIRNESEAANCSYARKDSLDFNSFIVQNNFFDLQAKNSLFTWFGPCNKKSRLDRILAYANWIDLGDWSLETLCRKSSDHRGVKLTLEHVNWGPKPFRTYNC